MTRALSALIHFARRSRARTLETCLRPMFTNPGVNFRFDPYGSYTFETIRIGDNVSIGAGAKIWATPPAYVELQDHVIIGPDLIIMAGDHIFDVPGQLVHEAKEKRPGDDLPVVIETDVWIGARATVMKGVRIGRGSIIAAGSVVIDNCPPYSILAGVPARVVSRRFTDDQIVLHEQLLADRDS